MILKRPATFVSVLVCMWLAFFSVALAERVTDFESYVVLQEDGSFVVTETITYDYESAQKRGIYRTIKNQHAQPAERWYQRRYIELELLSVQRDGQSEPYTIEDYDGLLVRIGDPDVYHTGEHTYEIRYRVNGAIAVYDDFEEFYWNVTGDEWQVPIEASRLVLEAPAGVLTAQSFCYAGVAGSGRACHESTLLAPDRALFTANRLAPGEQLTVSQRIQLPERPLVLQKINQAILFLIGFGLWLICLVAYAYFWKTHHKVTQTVIPQYEPLPDFKPMFTGVLFDGRLDSRDISAGIVYLAEQGFISIKEVKNDVLFLFKQTDYEVTLHRPLAEVENESLKTILEMLFVEQKASLGSVLSALFTNAAATKDFDQTSLVGKTISLAELKKDKARLRKNAATLSKLRKAVKEELTATGYFEKRFQPVSEAKPITGILLVGAVIAAVSVATAGAVFVFFLFFSAALVVPFMLSRRTKKGYEARNYLKGFKDFLSTTEKERYKFHNAPSKSPEQFMEFLPYAIAFCVEKEWAEVFADIQLTDPDWYQGSAPGSSFNAVAFSQSISSFSSAFSSSSGASGSSGAGSAGGGSGGGGGGSW